MINFIFGVVTTVAVITVGILIAAIRHAAKTDKRPDFKNDKTYRIRVIHVTGK